MRKIHTLKAAARRDLRQGKLLFVCCKRSASLVATIYFIVAEESERGTHGYRQLHKLINEEEETSL